MPDYTVRASGNWSATGVICSENLNQKTMKTTTPTERYTVKKGGLYWSRRTLAGPNCFCEPSINRCYSYDLGDAERLAIATGGDLVEVLPAGVLGSVEGRTLSKEVAR